MFDSQPAGGGQGFIKFNAGKSRRHFGNLLPAPGVGMAHADLAGRNGDLRLFAQFPEGQAERQPDRQHVEPEEAEDRRGAHRPEHQARKEEHDRHDRHADGEPALAEGAVGREEGIEVNRFGRRGHRF